MRKFFIVFIIFVMMTNVFGQVNKGREANARSFVEALAKKDLSAAYNLLADDAKAKISTEVFPQIWAQVTDAFGALKSLKDLKSAANDEFLTANLEFEKSVQTFVFGFDGSNKILNFTVAPPDNASNAKAVYETPNYADTNSFAETDVTVGKGEWALPATLSMPKNKTNVPALVLVHGSGANDRDESHINKSNKVFKDLAWGLASRGIAVLRYDKRSLVHGKKLATVKDATVNEETVDDAIFAVDVLRKTPNVDAKKIYVLGHSLGGMMIPRIGERNKKIAGFIIFAGTTRPLEDVILEQTEYLLSVDGNVSAEEQKYLDETKKSVAEIKALKPKDADSTKFIYGARAPYWLDLRNYDPPKVVQKLKKPILILQGEADYQVTMKDFANWKNALGTRKNVVFKTYPNLSHTFMETAGGKPSPKDYEKTSHVSDVVINDIAEWILSLK